jgi:hypothetical protein
MNQLQTVLDALTNDGTHEDGCPDSNYCFNTECDYCQPIRAMRELNAIAVVKQMMQAEPVAFLKVQYEGGHENLETTFEGDSEAFPVFTAHAENYAQWCTSNILERQVQKPLTTEQIQSAYIRAYNGGDHGRDFENAFARAIEKAHGII